MTVTWCWRKLKFGPACTKTRPGPSAPTLWKTETLHNLASTERMCTLTHMKRHVHDLTRLHQISRVHCREKYATRMLAGVGIAGYASIGTP